MPIVFARGAVVRIFPSWVNRVFLFSVSVSTASGISITITRKMISSLMSMNVNSNWAQPPLRSLPTCWHKKGFNYIRGSPMKKLALTLLLFLVAVGLAPGQPVAEKIDSAIIEQIKDEGLNRSQVMDILSTLSD